jgi:hypothetical protein
MKQPGRIMGCGYVGMIYAIKFLGHNLETLPIATLLKVAEGHFAGRNKSNFILHSY